MNRSYFADTDTLVFNFGDFYVDGPIDHADIDYQTSLEYDCEGNLVALTVEHAKERGLPASSWWVAPPRAGAAAPPVRQSYVEAADTLMFGCSTEPIVEQIDLDEQTSLELDGNGNLVALTIAHAKERGVLPELPVEPAVEEVA